MCSFGSDFRAKVILSLALGSGLGWVSFTGSGSRARVGFFGWPSYPIVTNKLTNYTDPNKGILMTLKLILTIPSKEDN